MGVLSSSEIKKGLKTGRIVIHPYVAQHVRGSSVDVTLGEWFYTTERANNRDVYNPFDEEEVKRYFGKPLRAIPHSQWCKQQGRKPFKNIPKDHPIIVLRPGERILAHTHEFIGIDSTGTTEMRARSSWGRNGIAACFDAGWGDPGYINRWTMEIYNLNMHESVPLPVGERIAQIIFHDMAESGGDYNLVTGKYQASGDLKKLVKSWRPESMLPRAFNDKRIRPLSIDL